MLVAFEKPSQLLMGTVVGTEELDSDVVMGMKDWNIAQVDL